MRALLSPQHVGRTHPGKGVRRLGWAPFAFWPSTKPRCGIVATLGLRSQSQDYELMGLSRPACATLLVAAFYGNSNAAIRGDGRSQRASLLLRPIPPLASRQH